MWKWRTATGTRTRAVRCRRCSGRTWTLMSSLIAIATTSAPIPARATAPRLTATTTSTSRHHHHWRGTSRPQYATSTLLTLLSCRRRHTTRTPGATTASTGRVRSWDGLIVLVRAPAPDPHHLSPFPDRLESYVFRKVPPRGREPLVGSWRHVTDSIHTIPVGGPFVVNKVVEQKAQA